MEQAEELHRIIGYKPPPLNPRKIRSKPVNNDLKTTPDDIPIKDIIVNKPRAVRDLPGIA